jgi:Zn-dependent protease/CBS domain-containing protein
VFGSVVLHEFGHALVARRFGIRTRDITLLPIGGVASLERMPSDPRQELAVAVAGPAVNVVIAAVAFTIAGFLGRLDLPANPELPGGSLMAQLAMLNVSLAVFNLIPAFPMDGGRVLRALLSMRLGSARATRVAARIGQALALGFGLVGLLWSPLLVFVALFVWMGASNENQAAQLESAMQGIPVEYAMARRFRPLEPHQTIETAVQYVLDGFQQDFPVVDAGRVVGVLTRDRLLTTLAREGPHALVGAAMSTDFAFATPGELLSSAHRKLAACSCGSMPVVDREGQILGLVSFESIGELLLVRQALERHLRPEGESSLP